MKRGLKQYLDHLFYDVGKQRCDFLVSGLKRTKDGDRSTKWYKYSEKIMPIDLNEEYKIQWVNQRQILPNEIVLDLEERESIVKIVKELLTMNFKFHVFDTGSRGFHIHIFFSNVLSKEQKIKFIRHFGGDEQMAGNKHMINLEWSPHWKSGKIKTEVRLRDILDGNI